MVLSEDASSPFDRRFLESMISHHSGAITMAEAAQTMSEHAEIRAMADTIIATQQSEIAQMHTWINDWYPQQGQSSEDGLESGGTIWIANEAGNSLNVIDASTQAVVTTLTGIEGPHNVQVAPDGRTVWAVSGHDALAVAIDAQNYSMLGTVPVGNAPAHVIVSPDGSTAWVSNSGDNTVTAIDTRTFTEVVTIAVGDFPHGLRPSPDGQWVAVANLRDNTVSLIDTGKFAVDTTIEVGAGPVQVAFAPDGLSLYVTLNSEDAVARIDLATRSVVSQTTVGSGPVQVYVTPDARTVLVANQGTEENPGTTLSFVDANEMVETGTVETGQGAHGVVIEPSGRYAYVTNLYGDDMAVVDLEKRIMVTTVQTGDSPNGISFSPLKPAEGAAEIVLPISNLDGTEDSGESETEDHEDHH
jgi:YVTN family beta-propeller protein